jgi:hypothetical protein
MTLYETQDNDIIVVKNIGCVSPILERYLDLISKAMPTTKNLYKKYFFNIFVFNERYTEQSENKEFLERIRNQLILSIRQEP